ncbi:glycosyltransferase family 4 protein [Peribacillus frigoritolerans]|uniref:glycosyltransferase family 4 protein n=1 Tax=Peribacillus frigoritolerans TaxID=450367 RepID=UPI00341A3AD4
MNILFVYFIPSGGVETLNRHRSAALKKKNIHCHFLYYSKERELVNNHDGPTFITNNGNEIKIILKEGNYSAIIITFDYSGLPRFRKLGYKGKIILEIQGLGSQIIARSELKKAIPLVTAFGDGILSSKTPHIMQILDDFSLSFPKFIFNNCFDMSKFSYKLTPNKLTPKKNYLILAWIGRIEDNKNWKEFLEIGYNFINGYNSNIKLYMFEDNSLSNPIERQRFQRLIKTLNLEKSLTIYSNIPNDKMAYYYSIIGNSGGFLCSTSKVEGFGYAIVEAMSCRCPVLTTDSDGVKNSIIHNQSGKFYSIGNTMEAVKEAKELMENVQLRDHIISTALDHVKVHFSPDKYSQQFIKMLERVGTNHKG